MKRKTALILTSVLVPIGTIAIITLVVLLILTAHSKTSNSSSTSNLPNPLDFIVDGQSYSIQSSDNFHWMKSCAECIGPALAAYPPSSVNFNYDLDSVTIPTGKYFTMHKTQSGTNQWIITDENGANMYYYSTNNFVFPQWVAYMTETNITAALPYMTWTIIPIPGKVATFALQNCGDPTKFLTYCTDCTVGGPGASNDNAIVNSISDINIPIAFQFQFSNYVV